MLGEGDDRSNDDPARAMDPRPQRSVSVVIVTELVRDHSGIGARRAPRAGESRRSWRAWCGDPASPPPATRPRSRPGPHTHPSAPCAPSPARCRRAPRRASARGRGRGVGRGLEPGSPGNDGDEDEGRSEQTEDRHLDVHAAGASVLDVRGQDQRPDDHHGQQVKPDEEDQGQERPAHKRRPWSRFRPLPTPLPGVFPRSQRVSGRPPRPGEGRAVGASVPFYSANSAADAVSAAYG
jgi:hypothetical protein